MTTDMTVESGSVTASCPVCEGSVTCPGSAMLNEILECGECRSELEVVSIEPLLIALAPEVEEDWGE